MAIYHCSVQVIGRSDGRSSVAAAAYRSGTKMTSVYDGITSDYTKKNWVVHNEIFLPENAPKEYMDRNTLWNAVETAEKNRDSQLAREVEIALPKELNLEQQKELVREYVNENFVSKGMCADIAIHNPALCDDLRRPIDINGNVTKSVEDMVFRNPHAHIMLTVRPIDENGKWQAKSQKEYLCIKDSEERGFTASEYKFAEQSGWQKQYKYYDKDNKKVWLDSETADRLNYVRVDRNPKCSKYGRKNPVVESWNSKESIENWRKSWELICNKYLEKNGSSEKIDSRSYVEQNKDFLPTVHMGPNAIYMEKKAEREKREGRAEKDIKHSDVAELNKEIEKHNLLVSQFQELQNKIKIKLEHLAEMARELKEKIENGIIKLFQSKLYENQDSSRIEVIEQNIKKIDKLNSKSFEDINKYEMQGNNEMAEKEYWKISERNKKLDESVKNYGFESVKDYKDYINKRYNNNYSELEKSLNNEKLFLQEIVKELPREKARLRRER